MIEFFIAKDYWDRDNKSFTINVLKFKCWQRKGNLGHATPIYDHIDTIYYDTEAARDSEWSKMLKDGYVCINEYEPPALKD